MELIQIIIVVFALFALSRAVLRFKDKKLSKGELLFWSGMWVVAIIISFVPGILSFVSSPLGIGRGTDLIIYMSIMLLFYMIFRLYVRIESVKKDVTLLVRKIAIESKIKNDDKTGKGARQQDKRR